MSDDGTLIPISDELAKLGHDRGAKSVNFVLLQHA